MNDANLADDFHITTDEIEDMIKRVALAHFTADLAANGGQLTGGSWTAPVAYATDGMFSSIAADAEDILGRDDLDAIFEWGEFAHDVSRAYEALAAAHEETEQ